MVSSLRRLPLLSKRTNGSWPNRTRSLWQKADKQQVLPQQRRGVSTSVRLYRILLRQAAALDQDPDRPLFLQPPLDPKDYGRARVHTMLPMQGTVVDADEKDAVQQEQQQQSTGDLLRLLVLWRQNDMAIHLEDDDDEDDDDEYVDYGRYELAAKDARAEMDMLQSWYRSVLGETDNKKEPKDHTDMDETDKTSDSDSDDSDSDDSDDDDFDYDDEERARGYWTTRRQIETAIRVAFQKTVIPTKEAQPGSPSAMMRYHRLAIDATRCLREQESIQQRTSISVDPERGIRIVATSSCIGKVQATAFGSETRHRFAYRIRVENLPMPQQTKEKGERNRSDSKQDNKDNDDTVTELDAVQLLGRTWRITEDPIKGLPPIDPVAVNAPTTGAVGHLPVLQKGQLFEYMSGCELVTPSGAMQGLLHFAAVDSSTTESAVVGDRIDALQQDGALKFEVPVGSFRLWVDEVEMGKDGV